MTMTRPTSEQITHQGRLLSGVLGSAPVNVMEYGAKGDGVTNDAPAFQSALDYLKAQGGGCLFVPSTPNGYYIVNSAQITVQNASKISIVSDGATIKLQPRASRTTGTPYVFSFSTVTDISVSGLRFEANALVNRYNNGDSQFDTEVNANSASSLVQTTFRYALGFFEDCERLNISRCYFGPGIYAGIVIKQPTNPLGIKDVRIFDIQFDGVNEQCVYVDDVDGLIVSGIQANSISDCKFDHLFYVQQGTQDALFSDIIVEGFNGIPFDFGYAGTNMCVSNVRIADAQVNPSGVMVDAFYLGSACDGMNITNVNAENVGYVFQFVGGTNVNISNVTARGCRAFTILGSAAVQNVSNVRVSNFVYESGNSQPITIGSTCKNLVISNGLIVDGASQTNTVLVRTSNATPDSTLSIENVRFVYTQFVPTNNPMDLRGAGKTISVRGCDFVSEFGTVTSLNAIDISASDTPDVFVSDCRVWNWTAPLVQTGDTTRTRVKELTTLLPVLAVNSATPSVDGYEVMVTANTSATTITNFTGGRVGQDVFIQVNDANTTFDFTSSNLKGNNGVDYAATSGDAIVAKRIGSNWYCTIIQA